MWEMTDIEIPGRRNAPSFWSVWASWIPDGSRSAARAQQLLELVEFWLPSTAAELWMYWEICWKYARLVCKSLARRLRGTTPAIRPVQRQSGPQCPACGTPPSRWRTVWARQLQQSSVYGSARRTAGLTRLWRSIRSTSLQWCRPFRSHSLFTYLISQLHYGIRIKPMQSQCIVFVNMVFSDTDKILILKTSFEGTQSNGVNEWISKQMVDKSSINRLLVKCTGTAKQSHR